jgi:hypothetical protein
VHAVDVNFDGWRRVQEFAPFPPRG